MDANRHGLFLSNPNGSNVSRRNEDGYVDDTSFGVDGRDNNVARRLTTAAQRHERTLFATGRKLALHKCTWVMINWVWTDGLACLGDSPLNKTETELKLIQSEDGTQQVITNLHPSRAYRTLGVWITADGNQRKQLSILQTKVNTWMAAICQSNLSSLNKQVAYNMFLQPQITYPLGCATLLNSSSGRSSR